MGPIKLTVPLRLEAAWVRLGDICMSQDLVAQPSPKWWVRGEAFYPRTVQIKSRLGNRTSWDLIANVPVGKHLEVKWLEVGLVPSGVKVIVRLSSEPLKT